jgi:hypothetical protein
MQTHHQTHTHISGRFDSYSYMRVHDKPSYPPLEGSILQKASGFNTFLTASYLQPSGSFCFCVCIMCVRARERARWCFDASCSQTSVNANKLYVTPLSLPSSLPPSQTRTRTQPDPARSPFTFRSLREYPALVSFSLSLLLRGSPSGPETAESMSTCMHAGLKLETVQAEERRRLDMSSVQLQGVWGEKSIR